MTLPADAYRKAVNMNSQRLNVEQSDI